MCRPLNGRKIVTSILTSLKLNEIHTHSLMVLVPNHTANAIKLAVKIFSIFVYDLALSW